MEGREDCTTEGRKDSTMEVGLNDLELSPVNKSVRDISSKEQDIVVKTEPGLSNCRIENSAGYGVFEKTVLCSNPDSCKVNCETCRENCSGKRASSSLQKVFILYINELCLNGF